MRIWAHAEEGAGGRCGGIRLRHGGRIDYMKRNSNRQPQSKPGPQSKSETPSRSGGGGVEEESHPEKILAIHFRALGDAVMMIPALHAIRQRYPRSALHVLVPESAGPLLQNEPSLTRLWLLPKARGRAFFKQVWPVIRALRAERFDRSVDFGGNDRGAIMSLLCGARERLAPFRKGGFLGRRLCFTRLVVTPERLDSHVTMRLQDVLSPWGITPVASSAIRLQTDPAWDAVAQGILPEGRIVCHIGSRMSKKEWPVEHWAALHKMCASAGYEVMFNTGTDLRELALLRELKNLAPDIRVLPAMTRSTLLAVLKRASVCISNDTGVMHFAAGLNVPTIGLFGFTSPVLWGPVGPKNCTIQAPGCSCDSSSDTCTSARHCMAGIHPNEVFGRLRELIERQSLGPRRNPTSSDSSGTMCAATI